MDHQSLIHLFEASVEKYSENVLLWEKRQNEYRGITYKEAAERVRDLCAGFLKMGIQKGDRVALISEGRNDWVVGELALLFCGAVSVPLSVKIEEPADLSFRLHHSGCKGVIVSGNHKHKVFGLQDQLPQLEFAVLLDEMEAEDQDETQQ
ncbi:MAG: AMP-binding protein, partial [Bacteroidales bacterium]